MTVSGQITRVAGIRTAILTGPWSHAIAASWDITLFMAWWDRYNDIGRVCLGIGAVLRRLQGLPLTCGDTSAIALALL